MTTEIGPDAPAPERAPNHRAGQLGNARRANAYLEFIEPVIAAIKARGITRRVDVVAELRRLDVPTSHDVKWTTNILLYVEQRLAKRRA